jgi:hypothetical protein
MGTILPHSMHLTANEIVSDGRHTIVAALVELHASSCPHSLPTPCCVILQLFFPCLQGAADALPGMAVSM